MFRYTTEKINLSLVYIAFRLPSPAREAEPACLAMQQSSFVLGSAGHPPPRPRAPREPEPRCQSREGAATENLSAVCFYY